MNRGQLELEIGYTLALSTLNNAKNSKKKPISEITTSEARDFLREEFEEWLDAEGSNNEISELADVIACASILIARLNENRRHK